ncbi:GntR family transcriptional regulator [Microbacterium saperdae]|uniref:GntR family transcriptional regulator n=1 Tax=Microbacterium saperdae TaxID=69368 RepID=A0A543BIS6_9MICO|nr:GntR family transcriptional regulator [Microbacterium saperdae]TQL84747.1 GntR family transcriptional regulator [Microbacterium saperdae]GGM64390.1 GntR family transcriptional regulator [Microbacterium saperdae]
MTLKPVDSASLRDRVLTTLRAGILDGSLAPGTKLTEPELARQLSTSRGPIREALRDLEKEGLVTSQARRSARVVEISEEEVVEVLMPIRVVIEQYAFRRAVTAFTTSDLDALEAIVREMAKAAAEQDPEALGDLDVEFHRFVIDRTGQEQGAQIWRSLQPRIRTHFRQEQRTQRLDDVVQEHVELLDALRSSDADLLTERVREHVMAIPGRARRAQTDSRSTPPV